MSALLQAEGLRKEFPLASGFWGGARGSVAAVAGVSFTIRRGATLGLVGESGCGKSTTARLILRLVEPTAGRCSFDGKDVYALRPGELRALRRRMQIVFQDPYGSLNPRHSVGRTLEEGLEVRGVPRRERRSEAARLLSLVGLPAKAAGRFPHEFSGGQRQRVAIARALSVQPEFLVADEPVSALDVSVQAQILNLLLELQASFGLTCLFVAHDLAVVRHVSDDVAVMYRGRIVEMAPAAALFAGPAHPYTRALLAAIPVPDPGRRSRSSGFGVRPEGPADSKRAEPGNSPSGPSPVSGPPSSLGCPYRDRCPLADARCAEERPELAEVAPGHQAACHRPG